MPRVTIIGGPNGAGKTLFARAFLSISRDDYYVNADVIARGLVAQGLPASMTDARAARQMLTS
jgi:predicted ABC-type ATPase